MSERHVSLRAFSRRIGTWLSLLGGATPTSAIHPLSGRVDLDPADFDVLAFGWRFTPGSLFLAARGFKNPGVDCVVGYVNR